jgi:hypothetical protein
MPGRGRLITCRQAGALRLNARGAALNGSNVGVDARRHNFQPVNLAEQPITNESVALPGGIRPQCNNVGCNARQVALQDGDLGAEAAQLIEQRPIGAGVFVAGRFRFVSQFVGTRAQLDFSLGHQIGLFVQVFQGFALDFFGGGYFLNLGVVLGRRQYAKFVRHGAQSLFKRRTEGFAQSPQYLAFGDFDAGGGKRTFRRPFQVAEHASQKLH